jgi:hypothetical protein
MNTLRNNQQAVEGSVIPALPEWTRITEVSQLELGAEYYVTWFSEPFGKYKNTIAEFVGSINGPQVSFEHSDLPWGTLEELKVYVAPRNPVLLPCSVK